MACSFIRRGNSFGICNDRTTSCISDATNIECSISRQGDFYVINGKKWWTSGAMDPRCQILILMGMTAFSAPKHKQLAVSDFGFDDASHGHAEITFENVRVPVTNILLGEGRGFEIAQCRIELEQARLLVLEAADQLDRHGNKKARGILAMAEVAATKMWPRKCLTWLIRVSDTVLSHLWATARTLRIADGQMKSILEPSRSWSCKEQGYKPYTW